MISRASLLLVALTALASLTHAATFEQGESAFNAKDYEKAAAIWQPLAQQNDLSSILALAGLYSIGLGVERNPTRAFELYKKAAQLGSLQELTLFQVLGEFEPEMFVGTSRGDAAARRAIQKAELQQIWLNHVHNCVWLFADRS